MEETGCELICGAPMTPALKGVSEGELSALTPTLGLFASRANHQCDTNESLQRARAAAPIDGRSRHWQPRVRHFCTFCCGQARVSCKVLEDKAVGNTFVPHLPNKAVVLCPCGSVDEHIGHGH